MRIFKRVLQLNECQMIDHLPDEIQPTVSALKSPQLIRQFCANYTFNPSALEHFSVQDLVSDPQLWYIGTQEAKTRKKWLHDAYPKDIQKTEVMEPSILQCGKCKQHQSDGDDVLAVLPK